jgi:2',3'-cyclic-nucleotide 2'-phosphodiesterase (5'-nucleotidase family)
MASAAIVPLVTGKSAPARAGIVAGTIIILADLHSAYERMGQLLAAVEEEVAGAPSVILINGDVFEMGNVVASRSAGAIDWALLGELARLAPTVLNLGNHEPDLVDDLADAVARARALGITVVSNIRDKRTGKPYADLSASVSLGDRTLSIVGIATNAMFTYPKDLRDTLDIPDPVPFAKENLPGAFAAGAMPVLMSHAGVVADRAILPLLPDGTLLIGGHDHLLFEHKQGLTRYIHTGSWASTFGVGSVSPDGRVALRMRDVDARAPASPKLADLIASTLAKYLTDEDRASVGRSDKAMTLGETGRFVARTMAAAAGANTGFIGHTTFGAGMPEGEVSKYAFDSVVRFDGKLMVAEVEAGVLAEIIQRANQDGNIPLDLRAGDYVYASPIPDAEYDRFTIVANDWSALNQKSYFGREDLVFTEVPDLRVKALVDAALKG